MILKYIISALECDVVGGGSTDANIREIIFDSRSMEDADGTLFCAIRTKSADGHSHISELYEKGVRFFMVDRAWIDNNLQGLPPTAEFLVVEDTSRAIELLASEWRKCLSTVVGITGSAGKTVVKEMIYRAVTEAYGDGAAMRSPRSWNSRLGVPMSMLEASPDNRAVIVEAGIDTEGDMASHAMTIRPDIGVLTTITSEHDAGFGSRNQKIIEKIKLFQHSSAIVYDASCENVERILKETYSEKQLIPVAGDSIADTNTKIAKAVVDLLSQYIGAPSAKYTFRTAFPKNRIDVHQGVNDCVMLFDDFTNDIRSLRWSLDFMRRRSDGRKSTLIMSDLFHGPMSAEQLKALYERLGKMLCAFGVDRLIAIGPELSRFRHMFASDIDVESLASTDEFLAEYDITRFSSETILVNGAPQKEFHEIRNALESPRHDTILEVNLDALVSNFNYYRSFLRPETGVVAMVKASAYGLGAPEVAKTLQSQGATYLAVAVVDEGVELRRRGITMPIMVLNPITNNYRALFRYNLEPSVFSLDELRVISREAENAGVNCFPIHIKLDTGMHRVGFSASDDAGIADLLSVLSGIDSLRVASVFSHLATADCPDEDEYTEMQLEAFQRVSQRIVDALPYDVKRHILNTAGIMTHPEYQYDMVRLGIGLYGVSPLAADNNLRAVASLKTTIISEKDWPAGTTIGYGRKGRLERDSRVATLPIGYADGVDRHLSNGAAVFRVGGKECPTIGNICMDQCMIDITEAPEAKVGDEVEIFGEHMPIERVAAILGTIPYEVLTSVSPRVRRIYFRD